MAAVQELKASLELHFASPVVVVAVAIEIEVRSASFAEAVAEYSATGGPDQFPAEFQFSRPANEPSSVGRSMK